MVYEQNRTYRWRIDKYSVPAQVAGAELERIECKHGEVTPDNVLAESLPAGTVLHPLFEWDDRVAALRHRLDQAREIIGNLVVVRVLEHSTPEPVRAWVNIRPQEGGRGYLSLAKVLQSEEYSRQMLQNALDEFLALRRKYSVLCELAPLFAAIDQLRLELDGQA